MAATEFNILCLPISFTMGVSFISGSVIGNLLTFNIGDENN